MQSTNFEWDVRDPNQVQMEEKVDGQDTPSGQGRVDYVLYDDNGTALDAGNLQSCLS